MNCFHRTTTNTVFREPMLETTDSTVETIKVQTNTIQLRHNTNYRDSIMPVTFYQLISDNGPFPDSSTTNSLRLEP